ncbi:MAG: ribosomal protein S18-alanine N-acetyltransferase [Kineosporiaceae bacterium]|nr:ribosomal protein S18-alanine N-acetyltransferase [Aeromicrobium sp.]
MIRAATLTDLAVLTEIEAACFGDDAWTSSLVEAELSVATRSVLLSCDDAAVVGYGSIMVVDNVADLQRIAVLPEARRRCLGRDLLESLLSTAIERGAARILLDVAASNEAAMGLYAGFGFTTIARRRGYYANGSSALVMEKSLEKKS